MFNSPDGQVVFEDMLKKGFVIRPVLHTTVEGTQQAAGAQRFVLSIGRYAYGKDLDNVVTKATVTESEKDHMVE